MVPNNDKQVQRLFGQRHEADDDPFLSLQIDSAVTGMPILQNSIAWFDCKLEGHLSPDAECRLYLGQVVAAYVQPVGTKKAVMASHVSPPTYEHRKQPRSTSKKLPANSKR
jgi:flavin reductase (DIM6/NTAB) family NADH-FMN oxidoreductase RutF